MEENFGNRVLKYISYISFLSIMLGSIVQFGALELKNIGYFSFSNVINDSILILFFLIFLSLGLFGALYLISQVLEYDNFTHIKKKSRNYFRIILTVCLIGGLIHTKLKVYPDRADFSIMVQLFDFAAIAAFYFTTYFLSFIYLQINGYRIYSYFKEKKKFKKLGKSILCIDFVLMIATVLLCIFYMGDAKQLIFTYVVLAGFIYVWNNNSNKNHLDFKRLLQENYIFSFLCLLVFFFGIMGGGNIHHEHFQNKCFIDKQGNEINIEYMNDKYIFTNNGTEIYKNNVDKFFQCN